MWLVPTQVLGESEKKTTAILDATVGCVLVIDEAYGLHPSNKGGDPYKAKGVAAGRLLLKCVVLHTPTSYRRTVWLLR